MPEQSPKYFIPAAPQRKETFEINEAIREVIILAQAEVRKSGISIATVLGEELPLIEGDRVHSGSPL